MSAAATRQLFAADKATRDARCAEKDAIVERVVRGLKIRDPQNFHVILMPALHGPEVDWLAGRGVPLGNMFAIERDPSIRAAQAKRGLAVPFKAMTADRAVDCVPFEDRPMGFVYLDYLGRPTTSHLETLRKLLRLGLIGKGTCLLFTLGVNRGDVLSCPMRGASGELLDDTYLREAVAWARGLQPLRSASHRYTSKNEQGHVARYYTTEMHF